MTRSKIIQNAYQTILPYASPQVKEIIAVQIPEIEKAIDKEIDEFGKQLSDYIESDIKTITDKLQEDVQGKLVRISQWLEKIESIDPSIKEVSEATKGLKEDLDSTQELWSGIGQTINNMVLKDVGLAKKLLS